MSEVTDAPTKPERRTKPTTAQGSNVWYELMTTDPDAATKSFYDARRRLDHRRTQSPATRTIG